MNWRYFEVWWDNGYTRGIRIGATGAWFFLLLLRGVNQQPWRYNQSTADRTFRWHFHLIVGTDPCAPIASTAAPWAAWHVKLRCRLLRLVDWQWSTP